MKAPTLKRLSDIAPAGSSLVPMEDIRDRDLTLLQVEPTDTQFGPGYKLWLSEDGSDPFEVLTSAVVVVKQLDKLCEQEFALPCIVRFEKQGRCWIIS